MISIRNCIFGFKCNADWDAMKIMKVTPDTVVRHCANCDRDVYQISSMDQLVEAIELNHCVAIFDKHKEPINFYGEINQHEGSSNGPDRPTLGVPARYWGRR